MWNVELSKELTNLTDNIEWNLSLIKEGGSVFDCTHDKEMSGSDLANEISKDALRVSELLKIYDESL